MTLRLRLWLFMMDLAHRSGSLRFYLWTVSKAGDATDWGEGVKCEGEVPF